MAQTDGLFVVRLWDGMDGIWLDITGPLTHPEAYRIWLEKTANGTAKIRYEDIDYYAVLPADTEMLYSGNREMFR
jgi:hypothetical protein